MMFRKLYWVTERVDAHGLSEVTGVYTSIPDLLRNGLHHHGPAELFRLTLTKLDCDKPPLASFTSPHYEGLEKKLEEFVLTDEFSSDQTQALLEALLGTHAA